jgi:DNA-binding transcriptional ArsR family regulator
MSPSVRSSASIFAALGDETRLAVVQRLCARGPSSLSTLSEGANVSRQAVTKHLHVLASAGLVCRKRRDGATIWELTGRGLDDARRALDAISRDWDAALSRLRDLVEQRGA